MRVKLTVGLIIAVGALALFFLSGTGDVKAVFYYSPTELKADPKAMRDRVRLKGKIAAGTVQLSEDKMDVWFDLDDGKTAVKVHYHGVVPDAFQEGLEAVVDGRMGASGVFEGKELVVKCPSKYESSPGGKEAAKPAAPGGGPAQPAGAAP